MLPRWHILLGAILTVIIWLIIPGINMLYLALIFLASFLIDFDHYLCAVMKTGRIELRDAFQYHNELRKQYDIEHKKGIRKRGDFHLFHTLEFHALIAILGIFWTPFFYVFIGMVFHSLMDLVYIINKGVLYRREFFFFNWLRKKI